MRKALKIIILLSLVLLVFLSAIAIAYPFVYKESVVENSHEYSLDPMLVMAIIKTESSFDKDARSPKDARGLMQISESTGDWSAEIFGIDGYTSDMLYEPELNIRIGTWYIRQLLNQYKDINVALAAYNAGSGNVSGWLLNEEYSSDGMTLYNIPFAETREYVSKVERNRKVYTILYGNSTSSLNDSIFDEVVLGVRKRLINIIKEIR